MSTRKVLICNLPEDTTSNEIIQELFKSQHFKYSDIKFDGDTAVVTLSNPSEARRAAKLINGQLFRGIRISVVEAPPSELSSVNTPSSNGSSTFVLVGNLSFDTTEAQFKDLMSPHGEIKNVILVRCKLSRKSKGYGFIEYKHKEGATRARDHFSNTSAKYVDGRKIRVEIVPKSVTVGEAKHSYSLFIDKLPKGFDNEEELRGLFSSVGTITYCKIARTKQGQPGGYALVDYTTVQAAERGQTKLDGKRLWDSNIRISFSTPGKTAQSLIAKQEDMFGFDFCGSPQVMNHLAPRIPPNFNPMMQVPINAFDIHGMPAPVNMFGPMGPPVALSTPPLRVPVPQPVVSHGLNPRLRTPPNPNVLHPVMKHRAQKDRTNAVKMKSKTTVEKKPKELVKKDSTIKKEKEETKNVIKKDDSKTEKVSKKADEAVEQNMNEFSGKGPRKSNENSNEKDTVDEEGNGLTRVVFADDEELKLFKEFQKFQELMKKQKDNSQSNEHRTLSLQDLISVAAGSQTEKSKPESSHSQKAKKTLSEENVSHFATKPSMAPKEPAIAPTKPSIAPTKPSIAPIKPSIAPIKLSPAMVKSSMPTRNPPVVSKNASQNSKVSSFPSKHNSNVEAKRSDSIASTFTPQRHRHEKSTPPKPQQVQQKPPSLMEWSQPEERKSNDARSYNNRQKKEGEMSKESVKQAPLRNDVSSSLKRKSLPLKPPSVDNFLNNYFGGKIPKEQDFGNQRKTTDNQIDTRVPYGNVHKSGEKMSSVGDVTHGTSKSNLPFGQQYQSTDGRDYSSKYSPMKQRQNHTSQEGLKSRFSLQDRLYSARGKDDSLPSTSFNFDRQLEREPVTYPRPRSDYPRQDPSAREFDPPSREFDPPYGSTQSRDSFDSPGSQRGIHATRYEVVQRSFESLRDILPPRDNARDVLPSLDRSVRDLPSDLPHRNFPPRDNARDVLPSRNRPVRDLATDLQHRSLPPRDMFPHEMNRSRDALPSRDLPRVLPRRDDRPVRDSYIRDREIPREREALPYANSRFQPNAREPTDYGRFERGAGVPRDHPGYNREEEPRYGRDIPSRESRMGGMRGPPGRYGGMDGPPVNKRPRY